MLEQIEFAKFQATAAIAKSRISSFKIDFNQSLLKLSEIFIN